MRTALAFLVLIIGFSHGASHANAAEREPQLAGASLMCPNGEPFLVFGDGLNQQSLRLLAAGVNQRTNWNAQISLQRIMADQVILPARPLEGAETLEVFTSDTRTAVVKPASESKPTIHLLWARTTTGTSAPVRVNAPEIRTIMPPRPQPGQTVRLFGVNFSKRTSLHVFLVSGAGEALPCPSGMSYSGEKGVSLMFERSFTIPTNALPGPYRLFVNTGGEDYGWSEGFLLEVVQPSAASKKVRAVTAPGDGEQDAASALQAAIDDIAQAGGGVVALGPGVFRVQETILVKPGVTLRGAGKGATTLISPQHTDIPTIFHHYRPVVALSERSALEHVTVDASPGRDHHGILIRDTTDAALRHCEVRNLRPVLRPAGKWVPSDTVVTATQHTRRLTVENCVLRGEYPFAHWGGELSELYFAHNLCEGFPTHGGNVSFRGLRRSVVEHNHIVRGGRGLVVAGEAVKNYFGFNIIENIRGTANGCEMFLYEMGNVAWEGCPGKVGVNFFTTPAKTWTDETLRSTADSYIYTTYALVTTGRGLGQCVPVMRAQGHTVTLARPWTLAPDSSSTIALVYGCMENVHVENQFKEGVAYSGLFGGGARNVWAGDEFERVSDGMVLWSLGREAPIFLNVLRDLRLQDRAGILLLAGLESQKPIEHAVMFANEIRACQVYGRERYPGNEYGLAPRVWRWPFNELPPGNARHVTFGDEAGIHLSAFYDWPGSHNDEDPKLLAGPAAVGWTLVWDSLVARSPLALRVSRDVEKTAVVNLFSVQNQRAISNSGTNTFIFGTTKRP